jgi:hypothetical protein
MKCGRQRIVVNEKQNEEMRLVGSLVKPQSQAYLVMDWV